MQKQVSSQKKVLNQLLAFGIDTLLWSYSSLILYKIVYQKIVLGLRYQDFYWSTPLYCLIIGLFMAGILFPTPLSIGRYVRGFIRFNADSATPLFKRPPIILSTIIILLTFITGIFITQISFREFFSEAGLIGAARIFKALLTPNWSIIEDALFAGIETIYMAFIATTAAIPAAFLLGLIAARNLMSSSCPTKIVYVLVRFVMNVSRSIEPLVWAIIFSVWVGIGPFAGMLALWLHSISSLGKLYSEQVENINDGPLEAMNATGAHPIQVIWYGVIPQIILPYLSFTIYRWDINVRMATIIGLVGGGGIGTMLMQYQGLAKWNEVGLLVIVIATIVWIMDWSSSRIRQAIK